MARYAENTTVDTSKSRLDIEYTLLRYGATHFAYAFGEGTATIGFRVEGRVYRLSLPMPDRNDREFTETPKRGYERSAAEAERAWQQEVNRRWRVLLLLIKAKLEAIGLGITTFEDEFLSATVTPQGATVGEIMQPQIEAAYREGKPLALLPMGGL